MATLREFDRRIRLYAAKAGLFGDEAVKAASSAILRTVAYETPQDVGTAVSNWQVTLGEIGHEDMREAYVPGEKGSTAGANSEAVIEAGLSVLEGYLSGTGQAVHITNNAGHIGALNDGHSNHNVTRPCR